MADASEAGAEDALLYAVSPAGTLVWSLALSAPSPANARNTHATAPSATSVPSAPPHAALRTLASIVGATTADAEVWRRALNRFSSKPERSSCHPRH